MLKHRVRSGVIMGAALLAALYFLPTSAAAVLLMFCCGLGLWEFYALLKAGGIPHFRWVGIVGGMALVSATWLVHRLGAPSHLKYDIEGIMMFFILASIFVRQMFQPATANSLKSMSATLLGIIYVAWQFNFLNKLLLFYDVPEGRWLCFYLVLVVKLTDVGAFFIGCHIGGRKFFPRISPAKTWSGVAGGLFTGILCSLLGWYFIHPLLPSISFDWIDALVLGVLLSAAGIVGDLIESLLKRASGVKDSGTIIQGMGGFLDVVDSLLFAAPVLYIYMRLFVDIVG